MKILTAQHSDDPDRDPYAAYRFRYRHLMDSTLRAMQRSVQLTGRK